MPNSGSPALTAHQTGREKSERVFGACAFCAKLTRKMLMDLLGKLWRRLPKRMRRWGVLLTEARFTVTVGAVVLDGHGRVLLLRHRFRPQSGWGIPGGFLLAQEQPEAALRRELQEEIGLLVTDVELAFARALNRYQQVELIFRCHPLTDDSSFTLNHREIHQADWFAPTELPIELSADQRTLLARALTLSR